MENRWQARIDVVERRVISDGLFIIDSEIGSRQSIECTVIRDTFTSVDDDTV